ncbi:hypothetical protein SUDANB15_07313 [Streptomyces sp. enrichment culture]|uniref:hypothetical protein n=1 Tax=Streptomyces sp. enrichment culture TaxID=1795815 RepID=UPI003F54C0B8
MKDNNGPLGCGLIIVISLILALVQQCGGDDDEPASSRSAQPSASASVSANPEASPEKAARQKPKKVTMSLAEIAETPGTFKQFKNFVKDNGTAKQKEVVSHLKGWKGFRRGVGTGFPILEVKSDYPVIDIDAVDAGDDMELELWMQLRVETQHAAEAFAAWWEADESNPRLQVFDRKNADIYDSTCIDPHSVKNDGACSES